MLSKPLLDQSGGKFSKEMLNVFPVDTGDGRWGAVAISNAEAVSCS